MEEKGIIEEAVEELEAVDSNDVAESEDLESNNEQQGRPNRFMGALGRAGKVAKNALNNVKDKSEDLGEKAKDLYDGAKDTAVKVAENAGERFNTLKADMEQSKYERDLKKYKPIFEEPTKLPALMNVVNWDKRMGVEACKDSMGFFDRVNGVNLVGVYKARADEYGVAFYPRLDETVYYVNPCNPKMYIELSEYFSYLNTARVAELKKIAWSLGATYFKVSIKEEKNTFVTQKQDEGVKVKATKKLGSGEEVHHEVVKKEYSYVGVADESEFPPGKTPEEPELVYWAKDENIKALVKMRMSEHPPVFEKFELSYNTSTGIKENTAAKLDGALKQMKIQGTYKILEEAKKETKQVLEYVIKF